jgi:hypothetical protein
MNVILYMNQDYFREHHVYDEFSGSFK